MNRFRSFFLFISISLLSCAQAHAGESAYLVPQTDADKARSLEGSVSFESIESFLQPYFDQAASKRLLAKTKIQMQSARITSNGNGLSHVLYKGRLKDGSTLQLEARVQELGSNKYRLLELSSDLFRPVEARVESKDEKNEAIDLASSGKKEDAFSKFSTELAKSSEKPLASASASEQDKVPEPLSQETGDSPEPDHKPLTSTAERADAGVGGPNAEELGAAYANAYARYTLRNAGGAAAAQSMMGGACR